MGSSAIFRKKTYLEKEEIDKIACKNNLINAAFARVTNKDEFLNAKGLNTLTNGLINKKIIKKIIQICGSKKEKLTLDDFCYFYALLNTSSFEAKLNFLLDFFFIKTDKLTKEKYIHKVYKYFSDSEFLIDIFLDKKIVENTPEISRDNVYSYIEKNRKNDLSSFSLYINNNNLSKAKIINIGPEDKETNENISVLNGQSKEDGNTSSNSVNNITNKSQQYDTLSLEFKKIENNFNGIFPISHFEDMLREINISEPLVEIIGNYITKKTKKSFLNFDIFKEVLSLLISEDNNKSHICKGLFALISYPKNYIEKNILLKYLKKEKELENLANNIDLSKFCEINKKNNYEYIESLENLQYLKYIFFEEESEDISIQYKCLQVLLKEDQIEDYIKKRLQYDTDFFLIDIEFWEKWKECMEKLKENEDKDLINNILKKLRMNTKKFCDSHGRILEGKEFLKDYIIVTYTIYNLFVCWYGIPIGLNILRNKIYLDDGTNNTYTDEAQNQKAVIQSTRALFSGIEKKTGKKFELELYPVFLQFHHYLDLLKNSKNCLITMKNDLKQIYNENSGNYTSFSRKTKFSQIAKIYNNKNNIDINNLRFWYFLPDKISIASMNDSFEELGIVNKAIVLIEEKYNNEWPSEKIKDINNKSKEKNEELYRVGLFNIGNTCYMNSVLQIFLNIDLIKDIFVIHEDEYQEVLPFLLNTESNEINRVVQRKGYLILEFINLLKEKWVERKRNLIPRRFKEICGEYNDMFRFSEQQDAHDFYTFLVNKFHEETNIKSDVDNSSEQKEISDTVDTTEIDLGNDIWANEIRKNASYFYALFMGQLKSTLICSECQYQKIRFEPFSSLEIPIPEGNNIIIEIILFRLPFSLRNFDLDRIEEEDIDFRVSEDTNRSGYGITISRKIKPLNKEISDLSNINKISNKNQEKNRNQRESNNLLNSNIPLKIRMEVGRKEKCSTIIDKLKCMSDLSLEKNEQFIEFIMTSNGKYIDEDLTIDETLGNFNRVYAYELLNYKGIINIFDYHELERIKILTLKSQQVNYIFANKKEKAKLQRNMSISATLSENRNLNVPSFYFTTDKNNKNSSDIDIEYDSFELLIPILHRIKSDIIKSFIPINSYQYVNDFQDFIILSADHTIKPYNLYEMMWKKYMHFLNCPSNYDSICWKSKNDKKKLPFIISIIDKDTSSCASCPWFRFCTGCPIDPVNQDFININSNNVIIIEWDKDVYSKEIDKKNFSLTINHSTVSTISYKSKTSIDTITIDDCLQLFTKQEEMKDIQCEKCKKKTLFKKHLEIEKLPRYLVIVLKRFKYNLTNSMKIQNLVKFPLQDLNLQNYVSHKNINNKYDLFGIINHSGTLEYGHYYSSFNINGTWVQFDDSRVYELNGGIESNKVYMLIYQSMKIDKKDKNLNLFALMRRAYKLYISPDLKFEHIFNFVFDKDNNIIQEYLKNCEFYYGEPVIVDGKKGFIIDVTKITENEVTIKIKLKKGFFRVTTNINKIERETLKKRINIDLDLIMNYGKDKQQKNDNNFRRTTIARDIICGSQVCTIY